MSVPNFSNNHEQPRNHRKRGDHRRRKEDEKEDELLVFGYGCRLFRDDEKASKVEAGLIEWQRDPNLKVDRFDCRLHFTDLAPYDADNFEASSSTWADLDDEERCEEEMCQEERYKDLIAAEERHRKEEEEKRLKGAGAEIGFNYDEAEKTADDGKDDEKKEEDEEAEDDVPYKPPPQLKVPLGITMPETVRENRVIEKTANFVAAQGPQMEIIIKARQKSADGQKFGFMDWDHHLNPFYKHVLKMIKSNRYKPEFQAQVKKKRTTNSSGLVGDYSSSEDSEDDGDGSYLHPLLTAASNSNNNKNGSPSGSPRPSGTNSPSNPLTSNYKLGQENDVYSALFRKLSAIIPSTINSQQKLQISSSASAAANLASSGDGLKQREEGAVEMGEMYRRTQTVSGSESVLYPPPRTAPLPHQQQNTTTNQQYPHPPQFDVGGPPSDYPNWHNWFYGEYPGTVLEPTVVPPPPDLQPVLTKTAEFVMKFGPQAEDHLKKRSELQLDFLNRNHPYFAYYQMRIRWLQYEEYTGALAKNVPPRLSTWANTNEKRSGFQNQDDEGDSSNNSNSTINNNNDITGPNSPATNTPPPPLPQSSASSAASTFPSTSSTLPPPLSSSSATATTTTTTTTATTSNVSSTPPPQAAAATVNFAIAADDKNDETEDIAAVSMMVPGNAVIMSVQQQSIINNLSSSSCVHHQTALSSTAPINNGGGGGMPMSASAPSLSTPQYSSPTQPSMKTADEPPSDAKTAAEPPSIGGSTEETVVGASAEPPERKRSRRRGGFAKMGAEPVYGNTVPPPGLVCLPKPGVVLPHPLASKMGHKQISAAAASAGVVPPPPLATQSTVSSDTVESIRDLMSAPPAMSDLLYSTTSSGNKTQQPSAQELKEELEMAVVEGVGDGVGLVVGGKEEKLSTEDPTSIGEDEKKRQSQRKLKAIKFLTKLKSTTQNISNPLKEPEEGEASESDGEDKKKTSRKSDSSSSKEKKSSSKRPEPSTYARTKRSSRSRSRSRERRRRDREDRDRRRREHRSKRSRRSRSRS